MQFIEKSGVRAFREFTFFVYQSHDIHWFGCNQIECLLIVDELYVLPINSFDVILFLFQFEDMSDEKLL